MRTPDGKLIVDLNDEEGAFTSASLPGIFNASINENQTVYRLFPYELNDVPVFTTNIYDASTPRIVSVHAYSPDRDSTMYYDDNNIIQVVTGASFKLRTKAQEPNVLNVENGVPVIKQGQVGLTYSWTKDGATVSGLIETLQAVDQALTIEQQQGMSQSPAQNPKVTSVEPPKIQEGALSPYVTTLQTYPNGSIRSAKIIISADRTELSFQNINVNLAGTYVCSVRNDIGEVLSETITIEVLDPRSPDDTFFRRNLIRNGFATEDTGEWSVSIGEVTTKPFLTDEQANLAKVPNTELFGYHRDGIYPYIGSVTYNSLDYSFKPLTDPDAAYFCRDVLNYRMNGGTNQAIMYQDIDLSGITNYISGRAYGSNGVRAYFSCIIGNALTRFIPTLDVLGPDNRYKQEFYSLDKPRISYENFSLVGPALLEESVTVIVQEYEDLTPLPSLIYEDGQTKSVPFIEIKDKLSTLLAQSDMFNEPVQPPLNQTITTPEGLQLTPKPIQGQAARIINMYNTIYPTKEEYYTYGQYAEHRDAVIRVLNPKTNKIRVTVKFNIETPRLDEVNPLINVNPLLELEVWRNPYVRVLNREFNKSVTQVFQDNQSSAYKDKTLIEQIKVNNVSKPMVTAMGLVLEPIYSLTGGIEGFGSNLKQVLNIPKPTVPSVLTTTTSNYLTIAQNTTGLADLLDTVGDVPIRFWKRYNNAKSDFGYLDGGEYNHDQDEARGFLKIYQDGVEVFSAEEEQGNGANRMYNFQYGKTVTIVVGAIHEADDPNWKEEVGPFLTIETINELGDGDPPGGPTGFVHLWPTALDVTSTPQHVRGWRSGLSLGAVRSYFGRQNNKREFSVTIPSNSIKGIYAGVRHYGTNTEAGQRTTTKLTIGPEGLMYSYS